LEFINVWAFPERRVSSVPDGHADNFFLTKMKINGSIPIRFENKCAKVKKKKQHSIIILKNGQITTGG
jgi:hypothetical protein